MKTKDNSLLYWHWTSRLKYSHKYSWCKDEPGNLNHRVTLKINECHKAIIKWQINEKFFIMTRRNSTEDNNHDNNLHQNNSNNNNKNNNSNNNNNNPEQ